MSCPAWGPHPVEQRSRQDLSKLPIARGALPGAFLSTGLSQGRCTTALVAGLWYLPQDAQGKGLHVSLPPDSDEQV